MEWCAILLHGAQRTFLQLLARKTNLPNSTTSNVICLHIGKMLFSRKQKPFFISHPCFYVDVCLYMFVSFPLCPIISCFSVICPLVWGMCAQPLHCRCGPINDSRSAFDALIYNLSIHYLIVLFCVVIFVKNKWLIKCLKNLEV